ncbi:MaoC/PaaZ C-terminal domain-containing protein [Aquidulcibacter paucihalophilus]|uniref:MaoC/PaaZ C-terminal domain-containing protein n=1 Tax=Aquidulcibacter paucihalophilus TaxID=1978549 RepID=UPI000A198603|nr:MaoC/PaaZ C-terminal domain-containing protein [Aquidulcibacter paucihalophilus]
MILTPTQADLNLFAKLSGDANPIHVDPAFAAASGFGRTVAHGAMLTAWLVRAAGIKDAPRSTSAMFPAPAFAGEALEVGFDGEAWQLSRRQDGEVVCRLRIDAQISSEETSFIKHEPKLPLKVGMVRFSETPLARDAMDALQDLQARAAESPLKADIADRLAGQAFMLGQISTLLGMELPGQGTNYLKQETCWLGSVEPGEKLRVEVAITRLRPEKALVDLQTQVRNLRGDVLAQGRALVSARDVKGAF